MFVILTQNGTAHLEKERKVRKGNILCESNILEPQIGKTQNTNQTDLNSAQELRKHSYSCNLLIGVFLELYLEKNTFDDLSQIKQPHLSLLNLCF